MFLSKEVWLTHLEWIFTLSLFPVFIFITPSRSFLLGLLLVPILIRVYLKKPVFPQTPLNLLLFGLLFMVLVSIWATYDLAQSMRKIALLTWGISLYWSLQNGLRQERQNKFWLILFICGLGIGAGTLSFFNPQITLRLPFGNSLLNFLSLILGSELIAKINPNEIGGILTWAIPLNLSLCLMVSSRERLPVRFRKNYIEHIYSILIILSLLFMTMALILTSSRTAIAGTLIAIVFMFWALGSRGFRAGLAGLFVLFAVALLADVFMFDSDLIASYITSIIERISGRPSDGASGLGTLNGRIEIWSRALFGIQDFSLTGMGMNTFREVVHVLYPLFLISPDVDIAHAHNQFLQVALDLGLPGLVFYISLWLISSLLLIRCWLLSKNDFLQKNLLVGLTGSMLASFVFGLADTIALGAIPNFIFWMLVALISSTYLELADIKINH